MSSAGASAAPTPLVPTRPVDRARILERYKQPKSDAPGDKATPAPELDDAAQAPGASPKVARTPDEIAKRRAEYVDKRTEDAKKSAPERDAPSKGSDAPLNGRDAPLNGRDATGGAPTPLVPRDGGKPVDREGRGAAPKERDGSVAPPLRADPDSSKRGRSAGEIEDRRSKYRSDQQSSLDARRAAQAEKRTRNERERIGRGDFEQPRVLYGRGHQIAKCSGWSLGLTLGYGFGCWSPFGSYYAGCLPWSWWNSWDNCHNDYWYWWGNGSYSYSCYTHPFAWTYRLWYGCWPYGINYWYPSAYTNYYESAPYVYGSAYDNDDPDVVIYNYGDEDDVVVQGGSTRVVQVGGRAAVGEDVQYEPSAPAAAPQGDATIAKVLERGPDTLTRMSTQFLADGDTAFRERRYADAAHFYAKAIECRPEEGVLYLVLSDALLATGDYHYGAFALRRALELDPALASSVLDKHEFYADPAEFDEQLQVLERFLADRPTDGDARLLLAANYLFGAKPHLTNDLLESGASEPVRNEAAGKLILDAAKAALAARK